MGGSGVGERFQKQQEVEFISLSDQLSITETQELRMTPVPFTKPENGYLFGLTFPPVLLRYN